MNATSLKTFINALTFPKNNLSEINDLKNIYVYNTKIDSDNLGDEIINYYCRKIFDELNLTIIKNLPTHVIPTNQNLDEKKIKIITGTNIIGPRADRSKSLWKLPYDLNMCKNIGLMGTGWVQYEKYTPIFTKLFLNKYTSSTFIHSVRDSYSEKKLKKIVPNIKVLNTACPTMWNLTKKHCENIPIEKRSKVVTTITDYNRSPMDWAMLDILLKNYSDVYVWIQGKNDFEYLKHYENFSKLKIIEDNFESYNNFLMKSNVDYVGTRLHAGIHALNLSKRSLIISIDNRANEIAKDTNLPIIKRSNIKKELNNKINTSWNTKLDIPLENIEKWKKQFY